MNYKWSVIDFYQSEEEEEKEGVFYSPHCYPNAYREFVNFYCK